MRLFWFPPFLWITISLLVFFLFVYFIARRLKLGMPHVGIDEKGVYWQEGGQSYRLDFVRVNGVQLIAKVRGNSRWQDGIWPSYRVIYRDSLSYHDYRVLRSFAAQQKILKRSEVTVKK